MDEVDSVLLPRPRQRRQKDSFQSELQAKLSNRRSQGLTSEITDSEEDVQNTSYAKDNQSRYGNRPGSAKRRPDKSPDLGRGLGTTTMRARDLTQLLGKSSGRFDEDDDDDDEEIMAANMGRSNAMSSWQAPGLKTPSPNQDPRYQRKTPTRESPKDGSRLDSIYGKRTPTRESPKDQGKHLESLYGRKTPTSKDASPRSLTKEDIIFGRKTPTSSVEGHRFPGMDGNKEKPWQPPSFRNVSPNSPTEHSRGSRGVTPTDSLLQPIDEGTPRLQRGERIRGELSPSQRSPGDRPIPQSRSKPGDRKSPLVSKESSLFDRKPTYDDQKSSVSDRKSLADRKSPYHERKSPLNESLSKKDIPGMKRATPSYDLFGKSRSSAAQEVEDFIQSDKKTDSKYGRSLTKSPEGRKTPTDSRKYPGQTPEKGQRLAKSAGMRETGQKSLNGKKTPTDFRRDQDKKLPAGKGEDLKNRKSPQTAGSSLLDFLTEGSGKSKVPSKNGKGKQLDDEIDDMFGSSQQYLSRKSPANQYKSTYDQRKSPLDQHRPSLSNKKLTEDQMRRSPDYMTKQKSISFERADQEFSTQQRRSPDMFQSTDEKPRRIPKPRKDDESSVCEEIPLDLNRQRAKAEEKAMKSGKQTSERAKANHAIDSIADAQTMQYIEPAKKIRPVTAEAKVQHRPKPRYGTLPGSKTQTVEREYGSTTDIRDAIYEQWYEERQKTAKKKKKEEEKRKAEEEEKKKKEEKERLQEAEMSYKAWVDKKKETVFREQAKKRNAEQRKKDEEHRDKQEKADEAMKTFHHWKEKKDAMIRHELDKKRRAEEEKAREKEEEEYVKRKDRETAFKGWKNKKERDLEEKKNQYRHEKEHAKRKKEEEKENQRRKEEEAMNKYYDWMDAKEKQTQLEKKRTKQRIMSEEDDYKAAWLPASRTIPFGR